MYYYVCREAARSSRRRGSREEGSPATIAPPRRSARARDETAALPRGAERSLQKGRELERSSSWVPIEWRDAEHGAGLPRLRQATALS
jgi:hypothetical protein